VIHDLDDLFQSLAKSNFRRRFRLCGKERAYAQEKGLETILAHARVFIEERLAPGEIPNDGRQTPMRNHPVFVAQHATATCCRGCLEKWHGTAKGRELTAAERDNVLGVLRRWLRAQGIDESPAVEGLF
jgi:predicted Fe-S protein YdhL (DUF1289 family)